MAESYTPKGPEFFNPRAEGTLGESGEATSYTPKGPEAFLGGISLGTAPFTSYQPKGPTYFAKNQAAEQELTLEQAQALAGTLKESGQALQGFGRLTQYAPSEAEHKRLTAPKSISQKIGDFVDIPGKAGFLGQAYLDSPLADAIGELGGKFLFESAMAGKDVPIGPRTETFLGSAGETLLGPLTMGASGQTPHEVLAGTNVGGERLSELKGLYPGSATLGSMGGYFLGMALTKGIGLNPITYAASTAALNEIGLQKRMESLGNAEYLLMSDQEKTRRIAARAGISALTLKALGSLGGNSQPSSFIDLLKIGAKTTPRAFGIGAVSALASDAVTGDVSLTDPEYAKRVIQSGGEMAALNAFMLTGKFASTKADALFQKATVEWKLGTRVTVSPEQVKAVMTGSPTDKPLTPREQAALTKLFSDSSNRVEGIKKAISEGITIDIPAERSVILQDREYWGAIKKLFGQGVSKPKVSTEQLGEVSKAKFLLPPATMPANNPNFVAVASAVPKVAPIAVQQAKASGSAVISADGQPVKAGFLYMPKGEGMSVSLPSNQFNETSVQNFMLNHYEDLSKTGATLMVADDGTTTGLGIALPAGELSYKPLDPEVIKNTDRIYSVEHKVHVPTDVAKKVIARAEEGFPKLKVSLKSIVSAQLDGKLTPPQAEEKAKEAVGKVLKEIPMQDTLGTPLAEFEDMAQTAKNLMNRYTNLEQLRRTQQMLAEEAPQQTPMEPTQPARIRGAKLTVDDINKLEALFDKTELEALKTRGVKMAIGFGKGGIEDMNLLQEQADRLVEVELKAGAPYIADPESARAFFTLYPTLAPKEMPFIITETGKKIAPAIGKYGVMGDPELQKFIEEQGGLGHVDDKVSLLMDKFRITMQVIGNDPTERSAPNRIYHRTEGALVNRHKKAAEMMSPFVSIGQKHGLYGKTGYLSPFDQLALTDLMEGKEPSPLLKFMVGDKKMASLNAAVPDFRKVLDDIYTKETAYLESIGEKYEPKLENYIPRIQKMSLFRKNVSEKAGISAMLEESNAPKAVRDKHIQRRRLKEAENPERNFSKLMASYIEEVADSMYMRPIVAELDVIKQQLEYGGAPKAAQAVDKYIKENLLRQNTALDKALHLGKGTKLRSLADAYIGARGMKALSFNPSWTLLTQWNSLDLLASQVGTKNMILGAISWANKNTKLLFSKTNTNFMKERGRVIEGLAGDIDALATKIYFTPIDTANQVAGFLSDAVEYNLNGISFAGGLLQAKDLGLTGDDAFRFADTVAQTQSMYNVEDRFYLLNSASFRVLKGFMTYVFDKYNITKRLLGKGGGSPYRPVPSEKTTPKTQAEWEAKQRADAIAWRRQIGAGMNLIVFTAIVNAIRRFILGAPAHGLVGSTVPVLGEYIDQTLASLLQHLGLSPTGQMAATILGIDKEASAGKSATTLESDWASIGYALRNWVEMGDTDALESELIAWSASFAGLPGGIQMQRVIKGYAAAERGYVADRAGQPLYSVEGVDKLIAIALGTSMTSGAIKQRRETLDTIKLESFVDAYKKQKAAEQRELLKKYESLMKLDPEERVAELKRMATTDKADVESLIKIREAHKRGDEMTQKERQLSQLLVKDGARAFAIYAFYIRGRKKEDIQKDMTRLKELGLVTEEINGQLVQLIKANRSTKK